MSLYHMKDKVRHCRILEATCKIDWLRNKMSYDISGRQI